MVDKYDIRDGGGDAGQLRQQQIRCVREERKWGLQKRFNMVG